MAQHARATLTTLLLFFSLSLPMVIKSQDDAGRLLDIAWGPDGTEILAVYFWQIAILDSVTLDIIATLKPTHIEDPDDLLAYRHGAWSPDGAQLALASSEPLDPLGFVMVLNAETGNKEREWFAESGVYDLAWSPDGVQIAAAVENLFGGFGSDALIFWDVQTGEEIRRLDGERIDSINALAWKPDGTQIATGGGLDNTVRVWDIASGAQIVELPGHFDQVNRLDWSPDGRYLATASQFDEVKIWDAAQWQVVTTLSDIGNVNDVAWKPASNQLAVATSDSVFLWDMAAAQSTATLSAFNIVAWSPDGQKLVAQVGNNQLAVFDAAGNLVLPVDSEIAAPQETLEISTVCPGSRFTRLFVGQQARVVPTWASNLRAEPSLEAERVLIIPGRGQFVIVGGPECDADYLWWQIEYGGQIGWTAEGRGSDYWLEPLPESEASTDCPGAAPQRLRVGIQARQALDRDPLLVLESPTADNTVFQLYPGNVVEVIGGPLCFPVNNTNISWWQIRGVDGLEGWVVEGRPDRYYLEPVGS